MNQDQILTLSSRIAASFIESTPDVLLKLAHYGGTLWLDSGDLELRLLTGSPLSVSTESHWMRREPSSGIWVGTGILLEPEQWECPEDADVDGWEQSRREASAAIVRNVLISYADELAYELLVTCEFQEEVMDANAD